MAISLDTAKAAEYGNDKTMQWSAGFPMWSHVILQGYAVRVTFFISRGHHGRDHPVSRAPV
jgi:hypothetical protein